MSKKLLKTFTMITMIFILMLCMPVTSEAKSAKSILNGGVKKMKAATTISGSWNFVGNRSDSSTPRSCLGSILSDYTISYYAVLNDSDHDAYEHYETKGKWYRRYLNKKKFSANEGDADYMSIKALLEYDLTHLKNIKLTGTSKTSYTITAKPNTKNAGFKKITVIINKKSGRIANVKYDLSKQGNITSGTETYSNICYGDNDLSLPSDVQ